MHEGETATELPREADVVFVGAGHNALVAASYLLEAGRRVVMLERMAEPGGWVKTTELGARGFQHDLYSAGHPIFAGGPAWAELGPDLERHGLEYVGSPLSTGVSLADGRTAVLPVEPEALATELAWLGEEEGWNGLVADSRPHLQELLGLLGAGLDSPEAEATLAGLVRDGRDGVLPFSHLLTGSVADLVCDYFRGEELRTLLAPWPLHLGASPADPGSALWAVLALAGFGGGNPTPIGGSGKLAEALVGLVAERGGTIACDADVDEIVVRDGRAAGVRTRAGQSVTAKEAVIVSATPDQLYGRLLRYAAGIPVGVRAQAAGYRYRRGAFQINLALSARPAFLDPRLDAGGFPHLGRGLDALLTSVRQAEMGLLPEWPTIAWHEPTAVDPTRAPEGKAVVRLQILDVPHSPVGDAGGTRHGRAGWNESSAEAFADRVMAEAELHAPGLGDLVLERHLTTPADLAAANPNAGPGDLAAGDNGLAQALTQRPIPAHSGGYRTAVPGVWLIGAATWPGPGVSGASGRAVARALTGQLLRNG